MRVIDSHTEGEPTRLIIEGGPDLGRGPLMERRWLMAERYDAVRAFVLNEPRGFEAMVGALLCEPSDSSCVAGLIFFNNAGYLSMCGHATIGAAVTLAHMGRINPGTHLFETPAGVVTIELHDRHEVTIENVPSYVHRRDVRLNVEGYGKVEGDVAWGGNWFFLTDAAHSALEFRNIASLTREAMAIRTALARADIVGKDGAEIDHVEFFTRQAGSDADSRNFVLCPGGAYDRSPCGTGLSAKLACLASKGEFIAGAQWIQESIIGSRFRGSYQALPDGRIVPRITGRAWVTAEAKLLRDPADPFPTGLPAASP
jgi:4-hydroxyproline epimerase